MCLVFHFRDALVWTKAILCAGTLIFFKGVTGLLTEIPDSRGGAFCVQRLTNPEVNPKAMEQLLDLDFHNDFLRRIVTTFGTIF